MATKTILLDVGGTFIKCSDGRSIPINSNGTREEIISSLVSAIGEAESAAIAIPGPFDYDKGIFFMKHKFAAVYGERFADLCGKPDAKLSFVHDVNGMLLGEMVAGKGKDYKRVALVTLGTGLGFSMSIDSEILTGRDGSPLKSIYDLPYKEGILEDYASKRGILRAYGDDNITVKEIAEKAYQGDTKALEAFNTVGSIIAKVIAPLMTEYKIEALFFGGQISRSFSLLEPSLKEGFGEYAEGLQLKYIGKISDIDNSTFNGLNSLL